MHQQYDYTISTKQILAILQEVYYKYYDGIVLVWAVSKMNTTKAIFSNDKQYESKTIALNKTCLFLLKGNSFHKIN